MKINYVDHNFGASAKEMVDHANKIIQEFAEQGFELTLRQLYYQFVSRDLLANNQKEYKRLGDIINNARLSGLIDWESIVDRTRNLRRRPSWENPADIVEACAQQFHLNCWKDQKVRPEVWIEKDALVGVISGVCDNLDVPYFSCRGYTSQSEMWSAAQRFLLHARDNNQDSLVIHLGDHDPSGIDMSRDIEERIRMFMKGRTTHKFSFVRIALNRDQIEKYDPPPNPAKLTDSRSNAYVAEHGDDSWELDALSPKVLVDLIKREVKKVRDDKKWQAMLKREQECQDQLQQVSDQWKSIVESL